MAPDPAEPRVALRNVLAMLRAEVDLLVAHDEAGTDEPNRAQRVQRIIDGFRALADRVIDLER